jgi:hypothetical protein
MAPKYQLPEPTATPVPSLTGRFLAHNQESRIVRAFLAADLHRGVKRLDKPTRLQAAFLARVSPTYACWAEKRTEERWQIEAGLIPLVPAAPARTNGNGTVQPVVPDVGIDDAQLMHIANLVGVDRMLAAAIAAGH